MNSYEHTSRDFLPLSVIRSACAGDTDAVEQVLHIFQGAVPKRGKGQTVSALVTIEEISLISRWRFMYSSMHT